MVNWDQVTKWIAGRGVAERSDQKKLERQYKTVEESLRLVKEVVNEPALPATSSTATAPPSLYGSPNPNRRKARNESLISAPRLECIRSISTPAVPALAEKLPSRSPDIPTFDLSKEEVKRNYSCNGEWKLKDQPAIPLPEMTGFGRYRRAVNASRDWQLDRAERSLHEMKTFVFDQLGDCPPVGMDAEIWRGFRAQHSRSSSIASSVSSSSVEETTGTKISRGFCASTTSSAASSFKDLASQHRRDSNLSKTSITSPSSDGDSKPIRPSNRAPFSRHASTTSISPLAVISELQEMAANPQRKTEKACRFYENANNESAVASDEDEEFAWNDMLELGGGASNLSKRLHQRTSSSKSKANVKPTLTRQRTISQERPKSRASNSRRPPLDRSKTIKASNRASNVRFHVPRRTSDHERSNSQEPVDQAHSESHQQAIRDLQASENGRSNADAPSQNVRVTDLITEPESGRKEAVSDQNPEHMNQGEPTDRLNPSPGQAKSKSNDLTVSSDTASAENAMNMMPVPVDSGRRRSGTVCTIVSSASDAVDTKSIPSTSSKTAR
ncbi:hypothetical protein LTS15_006035 [Exophiala xenobiotica]|nr:hypothetical protein LTS15_006035 [Exophiala xenobiotica]